jgi:hypothetical protein
MKRHRLIIAAVLQALGALVPSAVCALFVLNGYIEVTQDHQVGEAWRALCWAIGPLALGLSVPLALGNRRALRWSRSLCFFYPLGPALDLVSLNGSLHGGETLMFAIVVVGVLGGAVVWLLLRNSALDDDPTIR